MNHREQVGLLFSRKARHKLALATLGSILVSLAETVSVLAVAPLLGVLMGQDLTTGLLGRVATLFGNPEAPVLAVYLLAVILGGFILKDVTTVFFRWWMLGFIARERADTTVRLLNYYLHAPYTLHLKRSSSDLIRVMGNSVGQAYSLAIGGFLSLAIETVTVLAITLALLVAMPLPTLAALAYFALAGGLFARLVKARAVSAGQRQVDAAHAGYKAAFHALGGVKEIKLRNTHAYFVDAYQRAETKAARASQVSGFLAELPKYIMEVLFIIGIGLIVLVAGLTGSMSQVMGTLGLLAAGAFRVLPSISRILASTSMVRIGTPALDIVATELKESRQYESASDAGQVRAMPLTKEIRVADVSFRYRTDGPLVLDKVNLTIPVGTSMAFVGSSGAGKSTLVDMLLGFHTPLSGVILADGVSVNTDLPAWQKNLAMVPQDVYLLDSTLRENIAFDESGALIDDERMAKAIAGAQLEELVAELPEGLETPVGERGTRLSGGQRQRIGIARALYRQPLVLILDEATSALDNETERRITETIRALRGKMTIIIVAHRLSTVRDADSLVFMHNGSVAEVGTFDEVRHKNAEFAHLVELGSLVTDDNMTAKPAATVVSV